MNRWKHAPAIIVSIALVTRVVVAQTAVAPTPTITSEGEAVVSVMPSFADFWFTAERVSDAILNAANQTIEFREAVEAAMSDRSPKPLTVEASSMNVPSAAGLVATLTVRVRFPIIQNAAEDERIRAFATLCDALRATSATLNCAISGPVFGVSEAEQTEQQAVSRATENALYKADAIAALLQSQVYAVESVEIVETQWLTKAEDSQEHPPSVSRLSCRGRVRVVYLIAGQQ